ncbi:hypothetical protein CH254_11495 [Rhodococcus sp. 06-412-2C]|uniref:hypothetical protein n=1 Tax=unclassified Rhodococcus (in: high G+C Gram-positive bacteria) TaxID=192944 RepID=UPI000BCA0495|nr:MULTISPECIES: hypothetical protein [unclassified Rhodococcus (in: high G+C Gram-positive bacteria)]OZC88532.1 hypothetical protein CH254_11495 [Rhodococcus sp. 06-412-2C]
MANPGDPKSVWSTVAVIVGTVAAGVVVAGLLHDPQPAAVSIPGCEEVVQPEDMQRINYAIAGPDSVPVGFDAAAKSAALIQALPAGTTVEPDAMFPPLTFDTGANAFGRIVLGGAVGDVSVMLSTSDQPAGPCFAGYVDERRTLSDGTVVDVTSGQNGSRVEVYATDGSHVDVSADRVLTVQQVTDIAMTPGLRNN